MSSQRRPAVPLYAHPPLSPYQTQVESASDSLPIQSARAHPALLFPCPIVLTLVLQLLGDSQNGIRHLAKNHHLNYDYDIHQTQSLRNGQSSIPHPARNRHLLRVNYNDIYQTQDLETGTV